MHKDWWESPVCWVCDYWWVVLMLLALILVGYLSRGDWMPMFSAPSGTVSSSLPTESATIMPVSSSTPLSPSPTGIPTSTRSISVEQTATPTPTPTLTPTVEIAPQEGFLAPDFSFQDLDGETVTLSDLRGHSIFVNYWATWCPYCAEEMSAIQQIHEEYRDQDFFVISVNATDKDSIEDVQTFVQTNNITFPVLLDEEGDFSRYYQTNSLPTSYFIDNRGVIQDIVIGGPLTVEDLRDNVDQLINASN